MNVLSKINSYISAMVWVSSPHFTGEDTEDQNYLVLSPITQLQNPRF